MFQLSSSVKVDFYAPESALREWATARSDSAFVSNLIQTVTQALLLEGVNLVQEIHGNRIWHNAEMGQDLLKPSGGQFFRFFPIIFVHLARN